MDLSLKGRHALVCGASRGIGRAAAVALAGLGYEVTALARSADKLDKTVSVLREVGCARARKLVVDLDDRAGLREAVGALVAESPVHILINNTGGPKPGLLIEAEEEALLTGFGRHVLAGQAMVQLCQPGMKAAGYGRIINVISTSVREPIPNLGVSNTIRGAMASWSKTLSRELPPGVTINNILPGYTATDRLAEIAEAKAAKAGSDRAAIEEAWRGEVPERRLGRPEETGAAIAFLASPAAGYIRGVSLPVDGGRLRSI